MTWARYALINSADNTWNSGPFEAAPDPIPDGTWLYEGVPPDYLDAFDGWDPVARGFKDKPMAAPLMTVGRFKLLLTKAEREAIRAAAATNADVEDFLDLLNGFTDGVSLGDPVLTAALSEMQAAGLLTADRVTAILAGETP